MAYLMMPKISFGLSHEIISEILGTPAIRNANGEITKKAIPSILNKTETIDEIAALSSRITEAISKAKANSDYRTARRLGRLKDSIYHDLVPAGGSLAGLNEARKFSVLLNDTFTRGVIGDLLKTNTRGAISVDPSLTLEHLMFTGQKGKVAVDGLRTAAQRTEGGVDSVDKAITDFFISKFALGISSLYLLTPQEGCIPLDFNNLNKEIILYQGHNRKGILPFMLPILKPSIGFIR